MQRSSAAASPDTYIVTFGQAGGHDVISGFRPGTDHLVFSGYGAAPLVEQIGAGTLIALSDGTQILLAGVSLSPYRSLVAEPARALSFASSIIIAAAFSPIMIAGALVFRRSASA